MAIAGYGKLPFSFVLRANRNCSLVITALRNAYILEI
jgi:hypothetical protein